jgi:CTP synthase
LGLGEHNGIVIHFFSAYLAAAGELKNNTAFRKTLMESGIKADILVCRTEHEISEELRNKLALFCNVKLLFNLLMRLQFMRFQFNEEGLDVVALKKLDLPKKQLQI